MPRTPTPIGRLPLLPLGHPAIGSGPEVLRSYTSSRPPGFALIDLVERVAARRRRFLLPVRQCLVACPGVRRMVNRRPDFTLDCSSLSPVARFVRTPHDDVLPALPAGNRLGVG